MRINVNNIGEKNGMLHEELMKKSRRIYKSGDDKDNLQLKEEEYVLDIIEFTQQEYGFTINNGGLTS
jgi:hypothetical protein